MTRLQTELAHMLKYLSECPISFRAWKGHFENKAKRLATWDPDEYSQLPMLLAAEVKRLESSLLPSKPHAPATRSTSPAATRSEHGKATTSGRSSFSREGR